MVDHDTGHVIGWRPLFSGETNNPKINYMNNPNCLFLTVSPDKGDFRVFNEGGGQVFLHNKLAIAGFRKSEAGGTIKYCQDALGVDLSKKREEIILRVADGVSESVAGQYAAYEVVKKGLPSGEELPIDISSLKYEIGSSPENPIMLRDVLIKKVEEGKVAATTFVEVGIKKEEGGREILTYYQLGDGGIIVIRPGRFKGGQFNNQFNGEFEIILNTTTYEGDKSPHQIVWDSYQGNLVYPRISGLPIEGKLDLKIGDVVIVTTDGLLKIEGWFEKLMKGLELRLLHCKSPGPALSQAVNEILMGLVQNPPDDIGWIVYVHR